MLRHFTRQAARAATSTTKRTFLTTASVTPRIQFASNISAASSLLRPQISARAIVRPNVFAVQQCK